MNEIIKDIQGFEGLYAVSNTGKVFRYADNAVVELLDKHPHSFNYRNVVLTKEGRKYTFGVHRLIALTFISNPRNKEQVNHKDGRRRNNRLSNLEWVTPLENVTHAIKTGLSHSGTPKVAQYGFYYAYKELRKSAKEEVRAEIMNLLGIKTMSTWYKRLYGYVEPWVSEVEGIEKIFHKHGIYRIWGPRDTEKAKKQSA